MKRLFAISTLTLFLSSASYASEVCDPSVNEECFCGKIPVMSEDGERILYHNFSDGCVIASSDGSSLKLNDAPQSDKSEDRNVDEPSDDKNDDEGNVSDDKNDDVESDDKNDDEPSDDKHDEEDESDENEDKDEDNSSEDENDD